MQFYLAFEIKLHTGDRYNCTGKILRFSKLHSKQFAFVMSCSEISARNGMCFNRKLYNYVILRLYWLPVCSGRIHLIFTKIITQTYVDDDRTTSLIEREKYGTAFSILILQGGLVAGKILKPFSVTQQSSYTSTNSSCTILLWIEILWFIIWPIFLPSQVMDW